MVDISRNGIKFKITSVCDEGFSWWNNYNNWEKETFAVFDKYLRSDMVYFDLGTYTGQTVLYASQKVKKVYGVELDIRAFNACSENIKANNMTNIVVDNIAISSTNGYVDCTGKLGGSSRRISNTKGSETESMTIESLMDKWGVNVCDFIKIDIEGAEEIILPAMKTFFSKHNPIVWLSVHRHYGATADTIVNSLGKIYNTVYDSLGNEVTGNLRSAINSGPSGFGNDYLFINE